MTALAIVGRSSSHLTGVVRTFARELGGRERGPQVPRSHRGRARGAPPERIVSFVEVALFSVDSTRWRRLAVFLPCLRGARERARHGVPLRRAPLSLIDAFARVRGRMLALS